MTSLPASSTFAVEQRDYFSLRYADVSCCENAASSFPKGQKGISEATVHWSDETTKSDKDAIDPFHPGKQIQKVIKHQGNHLTCDKTSGESTASRGQTSSESESIADFGEYLDECKGCYEALSTVHWKRFKEDLDDCKFKSEMYPILARFLTRMCIVVCKPRKNTDKCLAVLINDDSQLKASTKGLVLRPGLVFKWTTYETARKIACSPTGKVDTTTIQWSDIVSYVEVKRSLNADALSSRASSNFQNLPQARPDLAGLLYSVITPDIFSFYRTDISGAVRSYLYLFEEQQDWDVLFRYVSALACPFHELPPCDPMMNRDEIMNHSTILCTKKTHKNYELADKTCSQSRQSCIFLTEADQIQKRTVKNLWIDEQHLLKDTGLLKNIEGDQGIVQDELSTDDTNPNLKTKRPPQTLERHLGLSNRSSQDIDIFRPTKRNVRSGIKKKLGKRRGVFKIVEAICDTCISGAPQICYRQKRILHRDASMYNVNGASSESGDVKSSSNILDSENIENKEDWMLAAWDTTADLDTGVGQPLTRRLIPAIYMARPVACGPLGYVGKHISRNDFPEMSDKAKALYISAYGEERYKHYRSTVNESPDLKRIKEYSELQFADFYDAESFAWILVHDLLQAWPKTDDNDRMNYSSLITLEKFKFLEHGLFDSRINLIQLNAEGWKKYLHPELDFLGGSFAEIMSYTGIDWVHWPELPKDHVQEALATILLEIVCIIAEKGDIELREEKRGSSTIKKAQTPSVYAHTSQCGSSPCSPKKRASGVSQPEVSKKSKNSHTAQDNACTGPEIAKKLESEPTHGEKRKILEDTSQPSKKKKTSKTDGGDAQDRVHVYNGPMTRARTKAKANNRNRRQRPRRL